MPTRIVAVTKVLNEDDIIEPFVRHHAPMVDHHVFVDNGSVDDTVAILSQLRAEGFPIVLFRHESILFQEEELNTILYHSVSRSLSPDWVLFLDADEFVDTRQCPTDFRRRLATVPNGVSAVLLNMINYQNTCRDDPHDLLLPRRIGYRVREPSDVWKLCIRGSHHPQLVVAAGNHGATVDGQAVPSAAAPDLRLAHYNRRSAWQELTKVVIGRLRVLSTGGDATRRNRASHYIPLFERLMERPWEILGNPHYLDAMEVEDGHLLHDPIRYGGSPLRYTQATDYRMKAVRTLLSYSERLARHHAVLLAKGGAQKENWLGNRLF